MANCSICNDTTPAPVSTVTVNNTIFSLGTGEYSYTDEIRVPVGPLITLSKVPVAGTLLVIRNNVILTPDSGATQYDYYVSSLTAVLRFVPVATDVFRCVYLGVIP